MGSTTKSGKYRFSGRKMKQVREERGLERRTVASEARIARRTIANLEQCVKRHPSAEIVLSIAAAMDCDPFDLFEPFEPVASGAGW